MGKRVVISLIAIMSLGAIWWTDAGAATTCVQYRTIGGSSMCTAWSTKGVLLEVTFNQQECGPDGSLCIVTSASAQTEHSIAFCRNIAKPNTRPRAVECFDDLLFASPPAGPTIECEPKHDQDSDDVAGPPGHDNHGCKATILLAAPAGACAGSCADGEEVADVTPVDMDTNVSATAPASECEGTCFININEHCIIDQSKIKFMAIRPYECALDTDGEY